MRHYAPLILAVLGTVAAQYQSIYSDNGLSWRGESGPPAFCPPNVLGNASFAYALDFKYDDLDDVDFIGGNAVKLYCRDDDGAITGYVSSLEGNNGEWQGIRTCPSDQYFIGFRLRVFPEQGTWGDDFGVDNIQLACSDDTIVDGLVANAKTSAPSAKFKREEETEKSVVRGWVETMERKVQEIRLRSDKTGRLNGEWGSWVYCPDGMYVLGIRTVVEEGHVGDDAGLTDVTLYCSTDNTTLNTARH